MTLDDFTRRNAVLLNSDPEFTRAILTFNDGSHIRFEHTSRQNRWAQASTSGTIADRVCLAISQFRLNAKHLQLFFEDGTDIEFHASEEDGNGTTLAEA